MKLQGRVEKGEEISALGRNLKSPINQQGTTYPDHPPSIAHHRQRSTHKAADQGRSLA